MTTEFSSHPLYKQISTECHIHNIYMNVVTSAYHLCESIQRRDIHTTCFGVLCKHAENGKLGTDGFSTAGRRTDEHIVITVVDGVEDCKQTNTYNNLQQH